MSRVRSLIAAGAAVASLSLSLAAGMPVASAAPEAATAPASVASGVSVSAAKWATLDLTVPRGKAGKPLKVTVGKVEKGSNQVRLQRLDKKKWVQVQTARVSNGRAVVTVPGRYVGSKGVTFRVVSAKQQNVFVVDTDLKGWRLEASPAAVKSLTSTTYATSASLKWATAAGATSYLVEMSTNDGASYTTAGTTTAISFNVTGLTEGVNYTFRVSGVNGDGAGPGAVIRVTTQPNPPAPLTGLTATPLDSSVKLGWNAPARQTGYTVQRTCTANPNFEPVNCPVDTRTTTARSFTWGGLVNGTTYLFRVFATNQDGPGAPATISATPMAKPAAVTNVVATPGNATIFVRWTPSPNADDYRIGVDEVGGSRVYVYSDYSANNFNQMSGLKNGTAYNVIVQARNKYGFTNSNILTNITPNSGVPQQPQNLVASPGDGRVVLTWDADPTASSYVVFHREVGTELFIQTNSGGFVTDSAAGTVTRSVGNLVNGVNYEFEVYATNSSGRSTSAVVFAEPNYNGDYPRFAKPNGGSISARNVSTATTRNVSTATTSDSTYTETGAPTVPPSPVTTVTAVPYSGRVVASWTTAANATAYIVNYSTSPTGPWTNFNTVSYTSKSANITGLTNGVAYYVQVVATNDLGSATGTVAGPVTPIPTPGPVSNLAAYASNAAIVTTWTPVSGSNQYRILYRPSTSTTWSPAVYVPSSTPSYTIPGLTNGTSYYVQVAAVNSSGVGTTTQAGPTVPSASVPAQVANVTATPANNQVTLEWPSVSGANGYQVYVNGANGLTSVPPSTVPADMEEYTISGLTNGTPYTFTIVAYNDYGVSLPAETDTVTPGVTPPAAPTNVTAVAGDGSATLSFTPGADGGAPIVNYAYSLNNGAWTQFSPAVTTSPVTITGLTNGTTYSIELAAVNSNGQVGAASTAVSVAPVATAVAPPTNLVATPGNGQASIAFTQTGVPAGATITNYSYSFDGGNTWTALSPADTTSPITITGLTNGTAYSIQLQAAASNGTTSAPSDPVVVTPATTPAAPTGLAATAGPGSATIAFTPGANGGSPITNYAYSVNDGTTWTQFSPAVTTGPIVITGLTNGVPYEIELAAVNAVGRGAASSAVSVTPVAVPGAVTGLVVTPGNSSANLTWDATSGATGYNVWLTCGIPTGDSAPQGGVGCPQISWPTDDTTFNINSGTSAGLVNGTTYAVTVQAVNSSGTGPKGTWVNVTPGTTPAAPTDVVGSGVDGAAVIAFTPGNNGGAAITNYAYTTDGGSTWTDLSPADTTSPITITGLTNGTAYDIEIAAVNSFGQGAASASVSVTPASNPSAPTGLAVNAGNEQVTISFTPGDNGGAEVTNYNYSLDGGNTWTAFSPAVTASPVTITGLTNGTTYNIALQAVTSAGTSSPSEVVVATPSGAPAAPTALVATAGDEEISISFTPGSDNGSAITNYAYSLNGGTLTPLPVPQTGSPVVITGLTNGTAYTVQLAAINAEGTSSLSAATSAVTPFGVPAAPSNLASTAGDGQLTIEFTAGSNNGSAITNYEYSTDGGNTWTAFSPAVTASPVTITGLTNGTAYEVCIAPVNAAGTGADACVGPNNSTTPFTAPAAPTIDNVTPGNGQVTVEFTGGSDGGLPITNYEYTLNGGATWTAFSPAQTVSPLTITGLTNGTAYTVAVKAVNAGGAISAASNFSSAFTPFAPPGAPTGLSATPGNGEATIAFTPATAGGYPIENYVYTLNGGTSQTAFSPATTTSPVTITGLTNGNTYTANLAAVDSQGNQGAWSAAVTFTLMTVPNAPSNVTVSLTDANDVAVNWTAPSGNGGNPDPTLTSYMVAVNPAAGATVTMGAFPATNATVSNLTPGTVYTVTVYATNQVGTSAGTSSAPFDTATITPTGLNSSVSYNDVQYTWNATTGAASYNLYYCTVANGATPCVPSTATVAENTTTNSYSFTGNWATDYYVSVAAVSPSGMVGAPSEAVLASVQPEPTLTATSGGYGPGSNNLNYYIYATGVGNGGIPNGESLTTMVAIGANGWTQGVSTPTLTNDTWSWQRLVNQGQGGAQAYWQFDLGNDVINSNTLSWSW